MPVKRNRPLNAAKRDGIVDTAGRLFMENGYHAVSMDMIAAAVPVSKPTLYNHFENKEALFKAVMEDRCAALAGFFDQVLKSKADLRTTLTRMAEHFLNTVLKPDSVAMYRVMIGESGKFPELGTIFYQAGPVRLRGVMIDYLKAQDRAGTIKVPDPELSAVAFINMVKGNAQMMAMLGLEKLPGPKERARIVDHAVELFLKGHGFKA